MTDTTQAHVERIFLAAQALRGEQREEVLRSECAADPELRSRVEALLRAAEGSESFFDELTGRLGVAALLQDGGGQPPDACAGERLGAYTLLARIATGGMGSVWSAERSDGSYEGRVAIKLLQLAGGAAAVRRFQLEGSYLARLTHPNIARLLDAGVSARGTPYLVIELVDGLPIDAYAERENLPVRARIELFLDVLAAVQHAHAHLVVHRDLKPSNVMVTHEGQVKLLDFGIAKLLQPEAPDAPGVTRELGVALTPEYAAPEQILGGAITTATDVYSLGLLLFRLLSGRHARERVTDPRALIELVTRTEPRRPSEAATDTRTLSEEEMQRIARARGATPQVLRRILRGDLDNIVSKALASEPGQRYAAAGDLAADLVRYLQHEPVLAQPQTVSYRVGKFVRRHRGGVAAALLVAVSLLATSAFALWQMFEARAQRDHAVFQQRRALASNEFVGLMFQELPHEESLTPRALLDHATRLVDQQYGEDDPLLGQVLLEVSRRYAQLGALDAEARLLARAEAIGRRHHDADTLATALCRRAYSQFVAEPARIRARVDEAVAVMAAVREPALDTLESCARAQALALESAGRRADAIAVLAAARQRVDAAPAATPTLRTLLMNEAAYYHAKDGDFTSALGLTEEALRILDAAGRGSSYGYLQVLGNMATYYGACGEYVREERTWAEIQRRAARVDRPAESLATFNTRHSLALAVLAQYDAALSLLQSARLYFTDVGNLREQATTDLYTAQVMILAGRTRDATAALDRAELHFRRNPASFDRELISIALARAELLAADGDAPQGLAALEEQLAAVGYPARKTHFSMVPILRRAAPIALLAGKAEMAERLAGDGLDAARQRSRAADSNGNVGWFLLLRARARVALQHSDAALEDARASLAPLTNGLGAEHPLTREARDLMASLAKP